MWMFTSPSPLSIAVALAFVVIPLFLVWRLNRKRVSLRSQNLVIVIETDAAARYEQMINVLDEVKAANARKFSFKKSRG